MRANAAEVILKGRTTSGDLIKRAAETAAEGGHTTADVMFSADYKKKVLRVVVEKAIKKAIGDQSAQS
jgi:CO/xanthine dehydrogenase FAD-binding subunit